MAPRPKDPKIPKIITIELSEELGIDVAAFSTAYYDAPYAAIARQALNDHIQQAINREPYRKVAFLAARAVLTKKPTEAIRVIDRVHAESQHGGPGSKRFD